MPCEPIRNAAGATVGVVCSRGRRTRKCKVCSKPARWLCDAPLNRYRTCDAAICDGHRTAVGERDYCPAHALTEVRR